MRWLGLAPVWVLCCTGYACSGSVSTPGSSDGGDDGAGGGASSGATSGSGSGGGGSSGTSGSTSGAASSGAASGGAGSSSGTTSSSSGASSGTSSGSGSCTATSGCSSSQICGFPSANGCSAQGQCFPAPGVTCLAYSPGCACDGTEINITCNGLPSGYETKPLAHTGACAPVDAGGVCTSDMQCGSGEKCCYPCGVAGCSNRCTTIPDGGSCPLYP